MVMRRYETVQCKESRFAGVVDWGGVSTPVTLVAL
jgi:hypothetical protein